MKVGKTLRTVLSFIIAFAMVLPGAVKVEAAQVSYPIDMEDSVVLDADITGISTNNHTYAKAIWTYEGNVYLLIDSTHDLLQIKLHNAQGSVLSTDLTAYPYGDTVKVGDKVYAADESQGNTKDSHLTVFKFPLASILSNLGLNDGGSYLIDVISEQGKGHWIYGTLKIYIPKAAAKISKTWIDGPKDPVKLQLYRDYKDTTIPGDPVPVGAPFTLTEGVNNLNHLIENLNYTDNLGRIYIYFVREVDLGDGYEATYSEVVKTFVNGVHLFTMSVSNKYTPPMIDIEITKIWKDETANDRPSTITYKLYADGGLEPVRTDSTTSAKNWKLTFEDLPKTKLDGTLIVYTVKEDPVPGYVTTIDGFKVTNIRSEKREIEVKKLWKDGDDPSGRPLDVTFNLLANGVKVDDEKLTSAMGWKYTFVNLDKYDGNGKLINYTITEETVPGYKGTTDGFTITNLRVGKVDIPVEKLWKDEGSEGRPTKITINLLANGVEVKDKEVTAAMDWKYTFPQMEKYDLNGKLISYTITEDPVDGYSGVVKDFKVTNTKTGTRDIKVIKSWQDDGDTSARPIKVTIYLFAGEDQVDSIELTSEMMWQHTFPNKPMYDVDGKLITYTIKEKAVEGYKSTVDGFTVTNLRIGKTQVSIDKIWKDGGVTTARPASIMVNLLANGAEVKEMAVTAAMMWKHTFTDLDKYDDKGKLITYTITEDAVPGYLTAVKGFTITNTRTGEIDIPVLKNWLDGTDPSGRPLKVTVRLFANDVEVDDMELTAEEEWKGTFTEKPEFDENGVRIVYTLTEDPVTGYSRSVKADEGKGFIVTNLRVGKTDVMGHKLWNDNGEGRPESITVNLFRNGLKIDHTVVEEDLDGFWNFEFKNLEKYDEMGKAYVYTVTEVPIPGYRTVVDGFTIRNTRIGELDIPVEKIWLDNGERDITEVTVNLFKQVVSPPPIEVDEDAISPAAVAIELVATLVLNEENDWKGIFEDLPEFDGMGLPIHYFLEEVEVPGYTSTIKENEDGSFTVTNLRTGMTSVAGTKTWLDEEGTSMRPETITINLLRNGVEVDSVEIGEEDLWSFEFKDLAAFDDKGIAYTYTLEELSVEGYETSYDGFDIYNLRIGEIDIPVEKIWLDNGERSVEEIIVHLYKRVHEEMDLMEVEDPEHDMEHVATLTLSEENDWLDTFEDLPEFDHMGRPIEYILEEVAVEGYDSEIIMNEDGSYTITNLRVDEVDVMGEKTWFDDGEESRPESITVILKRNGVEVERKVVTPDEEGLWKYEFLELPEFDEEGIAYTYTVEELPVEGYNTFIVGYNIQNVRFGMTNVNGEKTWNDLFGRPASITVNLLQNGVKIDDMIVQPDTAGKWLYSFTELPEFDATGKAYTYTVTENPVTGYAPTITGYNILNRQLRGTLRIEKIDDFDEPVEDVVFEVRNGAGVLIFRGTTDDEGILEVVLPLGTYVVREISAPADYIMDTTPKNVTIDEDGEVIRLTVVNILEVEDVEPKPLPEKPKPQLPSTGAQSAGIWYGMGIFTLLAGVLLLRKRRTI